MKFGSVCSGIEAASVAWESLGFEAQWFSEIEHFPSEVLKYRYPTVPNLGDMTKLTTNETFKASTIDLLVGGTPCQSFSVAGLRGGLADPRGNLMLTFLSLADAKKPRWIVWENVPGVLSSNGGKDFGTFLGALGELGYGFAFRILNAEHFGIPQRRRRVFVIGYLGDWRPAAAVLFERESLSRDFKSSRKKGKETPTDAEGGVRATGFAGNVESNVAACLQTTCDDYSRADGFNTIIEQVAHPVHAFKVRSGCEGGGKGYLGEDEKAFTISTTQDQQIAQPISWDSEVNCNINKMGTIVRGGQGGRTDGVAQPIAFQPGNLARDAGAEPSTKTFPTLRANLGDQSPHVAQPKYFENHAQDSRVTGPHDIGNTVSAKYGMGGGNTPLVSQPIAVDVYNQTIDGQTSATLTKAVGGTNTSGPKIAQPISIAENTIGRQPMNGGNGDGFTEDGPMYTLNATGVHGVAQPIAFQLSGDRDNPSVSVSDMAFCIPANPMSDRSQAVAQPIAIDWRTAQVDQGIAQTLKTDLAKMSGPCVAVDTYNYTTNDHTTQTIRTNTSTEHIGAVLQTKSAGFLPTQGSAAKGIGYEIEQAPTLRAGCDNYGLHHPPMAIRRLTPKECERLQGFPDDWTKIPYRNKPADQCPDGPRYKACGNSMAVPVMRWIGQRIQLIDTILNG